VGRPRSENPSRRALQARARRDGPRRLVETEWGLASERAAMELMREDLLLEVKEAVEEKVERKTE
jgi:hypothetical protein